MTGDLVRAILRLAWPVYIAQIAIMANGVIDTVMAGHYGTVDLAAVGIGASVYVTLFVTLMGVLLALTPMVAQLHGVIDDLLSELKLPLRNAEGKRRCEPHAHDRRSGVDQA